MKRRRSQQLSLPIALNQPSTRRPGQHRRRIAWGIVVLLSAALLAVLAFIESTTLRAPPDERPPPDLRMQQARAAKVAGLSVAGGTLSRQKGVRVLELWSTPRANGFAYGTLLAREIVASPPVIRQQRSAGRGRVARFFERLRLRWHLRELAQDMPADCLVELASIARASSMFSTTGDLFSLLARRHAFVELAAAARPGAFRGTLSLATWGRQTPSNGLLAAYSFAARHTTGPTPSALVLAFRPADGLSHIGLTWPGLVGFVAGLNSHKLFVALIPAHSDRAVGRGVPATLVVRAILRRAASISQAIATMKEFEALGPFSLLIADGGSAKAVVAETLAGKLAIRRPDATRGSQFIVTTDHLRHRRHRADATNERFRRHTSSGSRYRRVVALMKQLRGQLDAPRVAALLRDRSTLDGRPLPLGHPAAINSGEVVRAIVVDLARLVLWISPERNLEGAMTALDVTSLLGLSSGSRPPISDIAPDSGVKLSELARYRWGREELTRAYEALARKRPNEAQRFAERAVAIWSEVPQTHLLLADLLWGKGQAQRSCSEYRVFLELEPSNREDVDRALSRCASGGGNTRQGPVE
jgi:hypothetical protein